MGVTIKDIAQKAGVSYSTVSRALNGIGSTNGDRRKRILEIAKEMGYVPNQAAIHLKLSRSYVIGLYFSTISKMTSPFVLHDVLTGVYSIVGSKYNIVVKGIDMHEAGTLNPTYYDGIIVLSQRTEDRAFMEEVLEKKIPMVVICRKVDIDALNVTTDETKAMETAMDYLIENGHRNICVIEGAPNLDSTRLRHIVGRMQPENMAWIRISFPLSAGLTGTQAGIRGQSSFWSTIPQLFYASMMKWLSERERL